MSQISPPIRILLVAVIGLIAVYMLFLRPKPEEVTPVAATPAAASPVPAKDPNAPTSSKPGSAVNQAVRGADSASARADAAAGGAVAETEGGAAPAAVAGTTGTTATTPATGVPVAESGAPAPVTKQTLASLPKDIRRPVRKHKVLVILFYNNRSADDLAVRRALSKVNRYGGQVFVDAHWIKNVSRYQAITRGVDVEQSPTIVVADRNLKADSLVGYVDDKTIDQAIVDALRASGGSLLSNPYFRKLDSVCISFKQRAKTLPAPTSATAVPAYLAGLHAMSVAADAKAAAVKPPKQHARFARRFNRFNAATSGHLADALKAAKAKPAASVKITDRAAAKGNRLEKKFIAANGAHGLTCF